MKLIGANPDAVISGEDELPGKFHYFIGNDPAEWRTNVQSFAKVRYHDIYPAIDLVFTATKASSRSTSSSHPGRTRIESIRYRGSRPGGS
jgi:hypothetical protein